MKKLQATQARQEFADTLNRVAYGGDRIVVRRRGRNIAAVVPVEDLDLIKRCEEEEAERKKPAPRARARAARRAPPRKALGK
jgi:prevent-host-death family protein